MDGFSARREKIFTSLSSQSEELEWTLELFGNLGTWKLLLILWRNFWTDPTGLWRFATQTSEAGENFPEKSLGVVLVGRTVFQALLQLTENSSFLLFHLLISFRLPQIEKHSLPFDPWRRKLCCISFLSLASWNGTEENCFFSFCRQSLFLLFLSSTHEDNGTSLENNSSVTNDFSLNFFREWNAGGRVKLFTFPVSQTFSGTANANGAGGTQIKH